MRTNANKLLYSGKTSQYYVVANTDVSCQGSVVRKNAMIAYFAVVSNMRISHDKAVVAYLGFILIYCTPVDSNTFTYSCIITNYSKRIFSAKFQILGNSRYNGAWKYATVFTYAGTLHNGYIRSYPGTFTYFHILMNSGKW